MPALKITIKFDRKIWGNPAVQKTLWNAARMLRDLWLSKAPSLGGDYVRGLQKPGSVVVKPGEIVVTNFADHAQIYETGSKSFNWGLKTLKKGKNVKTAKDGSKYKIIKVEPKGRVSFRKNTVSSNVVAAFRATIPKGKSTFASYSNFKDINRFKSKPSLGKPLKPRKPLKNAMRGFFVVSERAIKANPKKWFHEKMPGRYVARAVQREAEPIIAKAIAQILAAEAARKSRNA